MSIYQRQKEMLLNTSIVVTIIGVGGIGFWVARFAAMTGIEEIHLFDPDIIEVHNLNRLDLSLDYVGRKKVEAVEDIINSIRPECNVRSFPLKFQEYMFLKTDWIVDCTDNFESQQKNFDIARKKSVRYMKVGYDGENISINNKIADWGEDTDGYNVIPSWCVPAAIVGALAVAKIVKYPSKEIGTTIKRLFNF